MKTALIGMDGHTFDLLIPWVEKYDLPNIEKILKEGLHGTLESTIPPSTAAAFPALCTGVSSENSGLWGWREIDMENNQQVRINTNRFKAERLWKILSDNDLRSVWLNVPTTYPPNEFDGWMVTGLTTPDTNSNFTHPPGLKDEILKREPEYQIHPSFYYSEERSEEFFQEIRGMLKKRFSIAKYLWNKKPWDVYVALFRFPDCVLHHLWPEDEEKEKYILKIQKQVDEYLGWFLEKEDVNFMFFSDHGFTQNKHHVNSNKLLMEKGWLSLIDKKSSQMKNKFLAWVKQKAKEFVRKHDLMYLVKKIFSQKTIDKLPESTGPSIPEDVDWDRSKAVAIGAAKTAILYLRKDLRDDKKSLEGLKRIFNEIANKNDLDIEFMIPKQGPDLLVISREKVWDFSHDLNVDSVITHDKNNQHDHNGIFMAYGDIFKKGEVQKSRIFDIPPTMLHLLDIDIPSNMDGSVMKHIFKEDRDPYIRDIKRKKAESSALSQAIGKLSESGKI